MSKHEKVSVPAAKKALKLVNGDKQAAYSQYIKLYFEQTGSINCGIDNADLQAFYNQKEDKDE